MFLSLSAAHAGTWEITTTQSGTYFGRSPNDEEAKSRPWLNDYGAYDYTGPRNPKSASSSGTITVTLRYAPDPNIANDKPPKKVWLSETASAGWTAGPSNWYDPTYGPAGAFSGSVSVSLDGQGEVTSDPWYKQVTKRKMTQVDVPASWVIVRSCSGSANVAGNGNDNPPPPRSYPKGYSALLSASVGFSVEIVNKGILISSNRDTTYGRGIENGVPVAVPNFPDEDGVTRADTKGNDDPSFIENPSQIISYQGNSYGSWGANSTYEWQWTSGQIWEYSDPPSGTWSLDWWGHGIPALILEYTSPSHGMPDTVENVHLKAVDPGDQVSCENDYYLHFHYEYEDFVRLHDEFGPAMPAAGSEFNGIPAGWHEAATSQEGIDFEFNHEVSVEIGGEASVELGSGGEAFKKILALKGGFRVSKKNTVKCTVKARYGTPPTGEIWHAFWAASYEKADGTCSVWGDAGYMADASWSANEVTGGISLCKTIEHADNP